MRELINTQNKGKRFRWCLVRQLNFVKKHPEIVRKIDRDFAKLLNFKDMNFPVHKKDYAKIEKQNNISISVLDYAHKLRYCD